MAIMGHTEHLEAHAVVVLCSGNEILVLFIGVGLEICIKDNITVCGGCGGVGAWSGAVCV